MDPRDRAHMLSLIAVAEAQAREIEEMERRIEKLTGEPYERYPEEKREKEAGKSA